MNGHVHGHGHGSGEARPGLLVRRLREAHETMFGLAGHADWYDRGPGRLAAPLYRRVAADVAGAGLPDGAVVLDVGTGPGRVPLLVAQGCPTLRIEGLDLSAEMIRRARRAAAMTGAPPDGLTYRVGDVRALPYADRSVDLVVSSLSLHHWADVPAGLAEIRRVLRPGAEAWVYDVRSVLRRVVASAPARELEVRLQPLAVEPGGSWSGRFLMAVAGGLLARLVVPAAPPAR